MAPLSARTGIGTTVIGAGNPPAVVDAVRTVVGGTVVVAGHGNTVPAIIAALGAESISQIPHEIYDGLFVVLVGGPNPSLLRLHYGKPSVPASR